MTGRERLAAVADAIMACPLPERNFIKVNAQRQTALVIAGHKPASEIHLFGSDSDACDAAQPIGMTERLEVEAWLTRVGLKWRVIVDDVIDNSGNDGPQWCRRVIYATALSVSCLDRMEGLWSVGKYPHDTFEHGRLSGFPDTAIMAFSSHQCFKSFELPAELTDEPIMATVQFKFSKAHWRDELKAVRPWVVEIKEALPMLYHELERLNAEVYRIPR